MLVEFSFIALILYLLLAGIIDFGRGLHAAQVIQQAADAAARELSRTPLPPTGTLTGPQGVFATSPAAQQIYQEEWLVVDLAKLAPNQSVVDYFAQNNAPILNQLLLPLMIFEQRAGRNLLHYPGQLVPGNTSTGLTVVIPIVQYNPGTGLNNPATDQIISVIPVVEEITPDPNNKPFNPDPAWSPFNLLAANLQPAQRGLVALRINYPFQAATLSAYQQTPSGQNVPVTTTEGGTDFGPYAGADGLGRQAALDTTVRPFRRVLSAQAIFRREVFE